MTKVLIVLTGAKEWSLKDGLKHFGGSGPQSLCFLMTASQRLGTKLWWQLWAGSRRLSIRLA